MRISDWSSDVCSSDLQLVAFGEAFEPHREIGGSAQQRGCFLKLAGALQVFLADVEQLHARALQPHHRAGIGRAHHCELDEIFSVALGVRAQIEHDRSEEHTSELQSLMRISYAVFCLKKKTNTEIT